MHLMFDARPYGHAVWYEMRSGLQTSYLADMTGGTPYECEGGPWRLAPGVELKPVTADQFGAWKIPVINNKGRSDTWITNAATAKILGAFPTMNGAGMVIYVNSVVKQVVLSTVDFLDYDPDTEEVEITDQGDEANGTYMPRGFTTS